MLSHTIYIECATHTARRTMRVYQRATRLARLPAQALQPARRA
jgi:hypothetical protein